MALIKCPECSIEVSSTAFKCTHCGFQIRKPKRGFFGGLFKWSFFLLNMVLAFWLFSYFGFVGEYFSDTQNNAEEAGAVIGATLGTSMLLGFWVFGDIILGLLVMFTRPRS